MPQARARTLPSVRVRVLEDAVGVPIRWRERRSEGGGPMQVAVASGKGGTGKTLVSTSLAHVLAATHRVQYLDCDVEEPNGHLYLQPRVHETVPVTVQVPRVDQGRCDRCGACSEFCRFNAIASLSSSTVVFAELCHSCAGCALVCPRGAITLADRMIGVLERGSAGAVDFGHGKLRVGEPMSPPLIRAVKGLARPSTVAILDAPPGTSCPVMTALRGCDLALLVTEPTPFGLHDLDLAVKAVRHIGIPVAVVINREGSGDERVQSYCDAERLPVWARIPHDRRIAEATSRGRLAVRAVPGLAPVFNALAARVVHAA